MGGAREQSQQSLLRPATDSTPSSKTAASMGGQAGAGNSAAAEDLQRRISRVAARASSELPRLAQLEKTFRSDLCDVRVVFGGPEAKALLAEQNAEAVAVGDHILFADANPSPALVAHEVTHVLQQRRGGSGGGEAEAEEGSRAVEAGETFNVQGGADETPQFSKSADISTRLGKVTATLSGASVTPPALAGGISDLHDWLMANQTELSDWSGTINVKFTGTVNQPEQVIWAYYHPNQTLKLQGTDNAVVTGFTEAKGDKEYATPGYFLCYRPIIPQAMSASNPAAANFEMRDLTVRGFVSGGVEIDPRSGGLPSAEDYASEAYNPESGHGSGGLAAFISGAAIEDNAFEQMGTKYMKPGTEKYAPEEEDGYKSCGYGGVVARGLNYSTIEGNEFSNLENRDSDKKTAAGGDVNWLGLIHGVYLRDNSSNNAIRDNDFSDISGAPVKFTNDANDNKVRKNRSENAGKDAFVLEQYNPNGNPGGAIEADSAGYNNKKIERAKDGKKYVSGNDVGSSYEGNAGKIRKLDEFKEKRVGG